MPDPFDFDDARRALDEVPAPDLWDEATAPRRRRRGRAAPTGDGGDGRRRRTAGWPSRRWPPSPSSRWARPRCVLDDDDAGRRHRAPRPRTVPST